MPNPSQILKVLPSERFAQILAASPKSFREELFRKAGVRVKADAFSLSSAPKNQLRTEKLLQALHEGVDVGEDVFEEVIRNYLYTRRSMLADALDHLKIQHDQGLTEADLTFLDDLPKDKRLELRQLLEAKYDRSDVELYLRFMNLEAKDG
jgi:hypothetical protein